MAKRSEYVCDCNAVHEDVINTVKNKLNNFQYSEKTAGFFSILGDHSRFRIVSALEASEMCVCDLAVLLGNTKSAISHQLKVLKKAGIVKNRREARMVFYSLDDEHVKEILNIGREHIIHKLVEIGG